MQDQRPSTDDLLDEQSLQDTQEPLNPSLEPEMDGMQLRDLVEDSPNAADEAIASQAHSQEP